MKYSSFTILSVLLLTAFFNTNAQSANQVLPTSEQVQWSNEEIGVIIHLDIDLYAPDSYHDGDSTTLPPLSAFRPDKLNTDQWIKAAKAAGAKYAVFVAKHGTGFANWPSKANDYNVGYTPWRNGEEDIVRDFIKSCKKYGIEPGVYYSVNSSTLYEASNHMSDSARKAYNEIVLEQEKELWTEYGKWFEIWFDGGILPTSKGGVSDQLAAMIKKYQPQAILFQGPPSCNNLIRWVGNEYGNAPYPMWCRDDSTTSSHGYVSMKDLNGNPDGEIWCPAESDFPSRKKSAWEGGWFWRANREHDVVSLDSLVHVYYHTVGRNTNLLIGMAIDTAGLFPAKETKLFEDFGKVIKNRFSHPIAETKGEGKEVILKLGNHPVSVNQIVIMEDIAKGQRIRKYSVEAWINNQWEPVCNGISVGHKRIQVFKAVKAEKLKLNIEQSAKEPILRKFAAYNVDVSRN